MEEKDIKIIQDTKILQQILKTIPENMHNQINVIMVNQVNQGNDGNGHGFDFLQFLKSLPEPRMKSLKAMAVKESFRMFKSRREVAKFLGMSERNFSPSRIHQEMALEEDNDLEVDLTDGRFPIVK